MAFNSNGTIQTNKLTINDTDGWSTQTEWEAYQSKDAIQITNGVVKLDESSAVPQNGLINRYIASDIIASDGDSVTSWIDNVGSVDLTGSGTYVASGYNGNAAVSFNSTSTLEGFETPSSEWSTSWSNGDYSFVVIAEPREFQPTNDPRSYLNDNRNGSQIAHGLGDNSTEGILGYKDGNNWLNVVNTQATLDETNLMIWSRDTASSDIIGNINGNEGTANITVEDFSSRDNGLARRPTTNNADHFNGNIYEVLIYDRKLTTQERSDLETYSSNTYGVSIV
jgi:hypothetical protein